MRQTKYAVYLTEVERAHLRTLVGSGVAPARMLTRARILLKADQGEGGAAWTDAAIAGALEVHPTTVARVRRQFVRMGWRRRWNASGRIECTRAPSMGGRGPSGRRGLQRATSRTGALDVAVAGR